MGPGETLSLAALVVMVLGLAGIVSSTLRQRLVFRQREMELKIELARVELEAARTNPAPALLESRVRVLERIATDRTRDLASQIDALSKPDPILN
jgi:Tfp pilus assembly protein PilO